MKTLILTLALLLAIAGTAQAGFDTRVDLGLAGEEHDLQVTNSGDASVSVFVDGELVTVPNPLP